MSLPAWPMRRLSPQDQSAAALCARAAQAGLHAVASPRPTAGMLLQVDVELAHAQLRGHLCADTLAPLLPPALSALAWSEVADLEALLAVWPDTLTLPLPCHPGGYIDAAVRVRAAGVAAASLPPVLPALQSPHGPFWLAAVDGPPHCPAVADPAHAALPLRLDLRVARLSMPLRRLQRLVPGAVVLLPALQAVGLAGGRRIFTFDFTLETCTVTETFDFLEDEPTPTAEAELAFADDTPPGRLDPARLPITVEVVLCQVPQTVGDLSALVPGSVFNLPADAWMGLQLRANGQVLASGELVQVGEQLGVLLNQRRRLT